jgi:multiple sugar transport system permease protein
MSRRLRTIALYAVLLLGALVTVIPLVWMVSASLMPSGEANASPPPFFPSEVTFSHYRDLFTRLHIGRYLFNSLLIAGAVTLVSVLLNAMAGYAFAKLRFRGRDAIFKGMLGALVIPAQVGMLPLFLMLKQIGVINTYLGVIIPSMATIFGIFLVRQYALSIPDSLLDAARIDGASEGRIFWSLVLPLCKPILVTLAIFTFLAAWNDFMWPLIMLTDDARFTLPVALANLVREYVQDTELMMAGAVLTVAPVLLLFMALQKYYIDGIMIGGVKE